MYYKLDEIILEVARKWRFSVPQLLGNSRARMLVVARHEAMRRCRVETNCSYPEIANAFGRDHSTIMYVCKKIHDSQN